MSRIRSQLDSILDSQSNTRTHAPQSPDVGAPRPAYPRHQPAAPVYAAHPAQPSYAPQAQRPATAEIESLHRSLEQLSRKIASMPKPDVFAESQSRAQADAARLKAMNDAQIEAQNNSIGQVVSEMRSGFTGMRHDFSQTAQGIQTGISNSLSQDLQRISNGIASLQNNQNMHPDYVEQMQAELANLNAGIGQLLEKPSGQVDLSGVTQAIETNYSDLVSRLDLALTQRGNEMPAIDVPDYSGQFSTINDRLEEMTRAVVSLTVNPDNTVEHHAFERIEARLASLSKTVDELGETVTSGDDHQHSGSETIAAQIARLSEKLDNLDAMGAAGDALGQEIFPGVTELASRIDALQNDIGVIAANLDKAVNQAPAFTLGGASQQIGSDQADAYRPAMDAIEQHLSDLAARMDQLASGASDNPNATGQEVLSVLRDLVGRVEGLEQIAASASDGAKGAGGEGDLSSGRFDTLEAHLAQIAGQLGSLPSSHGDTASLEPITERLDNIEGQIAASRDIVIDIATEAAQRAVAGGVGGHEASQTLAAMMEEIRAMRLEKSDAPVSSDMQQDHQLAEIGSTMAAIADRLAQIEANSVNQSYQPDQQQIRSSAQYAQAQTEAEYQASTAYAAETHSDAYEPAFRQTAAATGNAEPDFDLSRDRVPVIEDAPSIDMAEDADFAQAGNMSDDAVHVDADMSAHGPEEDVPLAPGSGMPDLETLVQRATRKKKAQAGESAEADNRDNDGLSDLMAAARRAAQAASVEAETAREAAPKKKKPGLSLAGKLPGLSKPSLPGKKMLLMSAAAIAVVAGGLFVSQSIFGGGQETQQVSGFEAPVESEDSLNADEQAGLVDDEPIESSEPRSIDMADGSTLLAPEADAAAPQVLGTDETQLDDESLAEGSTDDSTPVRSASLPATGDMPPEEIGNLAFRQAIASGNGDALFEAGKRYTDGQIVPRDLNEAVKWYTMAAEAGHAPAQYRLGNFYEKGHGIEANPAEAVKWYDRAAAQGNALAMHNLAVLNAMGVVGGDADMPAAISWFEKAADLGVKDSQVNLGILFTKGMGVSEDLEKAYKWFAIAAKGGDADAAKKRDTVAQAMRPEQLEKARGEAEIWKPAKLEASANVARVMDEWKPAVDTAKLTKAQMVKLAQEMLTKAGFDAGPADGMMGEKTRNAIAAFQEANGLPVDGTVSRGLMEALAGKVNI